MDVIVAGGGVSGTVAAIAAARNGAETLLVEQYGFCGGTLTNSGVGPMMTFHAGNRQVVKGIAQEIIGLLAARGASCGHIEDTTGYASSITPFDSEQLKLVLDDMLAESGCKVLYHTMLAGAHVNRDRIEDIQVVNKAGLQTLEASLFIDATGDGDLCFHAGAALTKGRPSDGQAQPMTTNFKVGNVHISALKQYIRENPGNFNIGDLDSLDRAPRLAMAGFYREFRQAKDSGQITASREDVLLFETAVPGQVIVNTVRIIRLDATDPWQLSQAETIGRRQVRELFDFLKSRCAGFEDAVLLSIGTQVGVRESRHLAGRYVLTAEDLLTSKPFPDTVALGGYPIDIHNPAGENTNTIHLKKGQFYQIPYAALLPYSPVNLLVSGRLLSATHEASAAIRVTPIAMATGQAAGTAAAICLKEGALPHELPVSLLQMHLRRQGACIS